MNRIAPYLLSAWLAALPAVAAAPAADVPQSVLDDLGNEISLAAGPLRIVSLAPSNTEQLFALGLGDHIVGVTRFCNHPQAATAIEQVAGFSDLSAEKIAQVRPNLVVASRGNDAESLETVRQMGVPVFALANNSVAQVIESVLRLGRLTGRQEAARQLAATMQARIDDVRRRVTASLSGAEEPGRRPRVLWGFVGETIYTAGGGSIIDDVIDVAGGVNLGREAGDGWPQVSLETVVDWGVDVWLTSLSLGDGSVVDAMASELARMRDMDGWRQLPAVKAGRLVHVDGDVLTRAGPRIIDAVEILAAALHPELSGDHK